MLVTLRVVTLCTCTIASTVYCFDYIVPGTAAARAKLLEISARRQPSLDDYRLMEEELSPARSARGQPATPSPDGAELGRLP